MKTFKIFLVFIIVILVSVLGCKKEEDPTPIISTPTTPTVCPTNQFFSDNIAAAIQSSTVDVSTLSSINSSGAEIWIGPNSFVDASGNPVTGNVDIELIVALDNKEMLMLNRPTVTNNGDLLISDGIIYINATQNGGQLQIADPISTTMPNVMGGNTSSPFTLWSGNTTTNGDFVWTEDTTNTLFADSSYYFNIDTIGWHNLDVLADLGQGVTQNVSVVLPSGLTGNNSAVLMYFTSMNSFSSISDGSNEDGIFTPGSSYYIPIGAVTKFVVVSMVNNVWSYHVSPSITITDPTDYIVPSLTSAADEQSMQTAILNAL